MSKQNKDSIESQWFLRTGPEAVFGPVDGRALLLWAEQARVLPGHEVSGDRKSWKPASSLDFLDMHWFIDDGDGDLKGPLNRKAAETLIKSGKFSVNAAVVGASETEAEEPAKEAAEASNPIAAAAAEPSSAPAETPVAAEPAEKPAASSAAEDSAARQSAVKPPAAGGDTAGKSGALPAGGEEYRKICRENESLKRDHARNMKKIAELQSDLRSRDERLLRVQKELTDRDAALAESERKIKDAVQMRERALQQARESERSFARLLTDANKRDVEYKAKIEALKKNLAISPDQTDRFYSDQNAVYQILKRELEALAKTMESERQHMDALKKLEAERFRELEKQRQMLQNHLGNSPAEMTGRVLREQTTDPNAVRLRSELDTMKLAQQRSARQFEERERDLNHKLKVLQSDYAKLMDQMLEKERESESLQRVAEKLAATQHELAELRKSYEAERKQFVANNNAMLARVVELEGYAGKGATPEAVQASDARGVKLASWMSFKR
jgi:hypothetical protein